MPERSTLAAALACALLAGFAQGAHAQACSDPDALTLRASVSPSQVVRSNAPRELFGFNVPWRDFQIDYFKGSAVRPDLIELLKPFKGAVYRYPGGTPSNWFEWGESTTGMRERRTKVHADYDRYATADFGPREFAEFTKKVDGRAILTLNLTGPYKKLLSARQMEPEATQFAEFVKSAPGLGCGGGKDCPVMALELGNELDWHPYMLSADDYVERAEAVRAAVSKVLPEAVWIANGRSSPWESRAKDAPRFNAQLARELGPKVQGIAIHPYYDGIDVPAAIGYVRSYAETWKAARPDAGVYVTEHARWPSQPLKGKWEDNWYQATSLGGAISTSDFMLALMPMPSVAAANWHALGTQGPWQLVRSDRASGKLIPSPVYWGMRVLREAYLDHVVKIDYKPTRTTGYGRGGGADGGYDQRLVAMRNAAGTEVSVLGVNRAARPITLELDWGGPQTRAAGRGELRSISAESTRDDNDAASPRKVQMSTAGRELVERRTRSTWCVPARSVFSVAEP